MAVNRRTLLRTGLTVSAIGAAGVAHPGLAAAAPATVLAPPHIYDTRNWGARPPNGTITVLNQRPVNIIVHHTAGSNSNDLSLEHAFAISRGIQNFHMDTRGWIDTGQQLTNSRGGHVTEGRHRSLEILTGGTRHVLGAHVANNNSTCIGIENEGLYMDVDVTPQLWDSLVRLVAYIAQQYAIPTSRILGHRDFNSTLCPGDVLYARLPQLRREVGALLGQPAEDPETWPLLRTGDTGHRVLAAQYLLRARGIAEVPVDGVFGPAMFAAVRRFARENGAVHEPCYGGRHFDESGLLGSAAWPLLVRTVRVDEPDDVGKAARVLLDARGRRSGVDLVDTRTWQSLLR
ncbi:MAG TPA: N-acetylmuramoyl-L-alanine amidase [Actinophytocola sp.]|uniref:peptidoglycan recognition protein family protein n=1 Tax=Actinophytocola sp. TaxID=1872138 RepID=UPI002DDD46D8|nr:N-acetylmuramoyl-L-alanine amidase [Actinophytocola sp.]HEV2783265.1 N-acetylmuramoyl-L-alanine amidase [Actinophytocola sp.]